jgi:hypothetical protein
MPRTVSISVVLLLFLAVLIARSDICVAQTIDASAFNSELKFLQVAADEGDAASQRALGLKYRDGIGVPKDRILAYSWLNVAAANGSRAAVVERDAMEKTLSAAQVAQAEAISRVWRPKAVLESEVLKSLFRLQFGTILANKDPHYSGERQRENTQPQAANQGLHSYETRYRFQGASSKPCEVVTQNSHPELTHLICTLFRSEDASRARAVFESVEQFVWELLPDGWFRNSKFFRPAFTLAQINFSQKSGESINVSMSNIADVSYTVELTFSENVGCGTCPSEFGYEPKSPAIDDSNTTLANSSQGTIRAQIERVERSGRFSRLPEAVSQPTLGMNTCIDAIQNRTTIPLSVLFAGPLEREIDIPAGTAREIELQPGTYKIVGRVPDPNVMPFFGEQSCATGTRYSSYFQIQ